MSTSAAADLVQPSQGRTKIKDLEVMVAEVIVETHDTATLVLFTGNDRLDYRPGHFCTIDPHQFEALARWTAYLEDLKGKREPARAYSLTSAPHERHIAITIKEERYLRGTTDFPPLLSPLLVKQIHAGDRMHVTGFTGPYTLPEDVEKRTDHLVHVVAGSGAVPNFAMLKDCLHRGLPLRHTFLCSNKTWNDIPFRDLLVDLQRRHPDRLRVVHTLTQERGQDRFGGDVRQGRISEALFRELIPSPSSCLVYACGPANGPWEKKRAKEKGTPLPPRFLETAISFLHELGVPDSNIKRESYG